MRIAGAVPLIAEASWLKQAFRAIGSRSNGSAIAGAFDAMPAIGAPPTAEGPATFPTGYLARRQEALDWLIR